MKMQAILLLAMLNLYTNCMMKLLSISFSLVKCRVALARGTFTLVVKGDAYENCKVKNYLFFIY